MSAPKIAAVLLVGSLAAIAYSVNSVFESSEQELDQLSNVEKYIGLLTGPNSKIAGIEETQLNNNERELSEWIRLDKQHFSLQLPSNYFPRFGDVYLSFYKDSAITCGQVAFTAKKQEWAHFISSRRSNVALMVGDGQLSREEFYQIHDQVCRRL